MEMFILYDDFLQLMEDDLRPIRHLIHEGDFDYEAYTKIIDKYAENSKSIYLFKFDSTGNSVKKEDDQIKWDIINSRVQSVYAQVCRLTKLISLPNLKIAYEFDDMVHDTNAPIFSFHKKKDYKGIVLVPDFELFRQNYYNDYTNNDSLHFKNKANKAIFVGSTTGTNACETRNCVNTIHNIEADPSVRIDAAKYFNGNKNVIFKLPSIVQCDSEETENYLRRFAFTTPERIGWSEQFEQKFIISIDGNGSTLSRVAIALLSNSVLLKYNSSWITYYHRALRPYDNYIPIASHNEIESVLINLENNIDLYEQISQKASKDFSLIFKRANVERYFAAVLNEFYAIFFGKDETYLANRLKIEQVGHLDIDAHIANVGDVSFWPNQEVSDPQGNFIEGITIYPASGLFDWRDISYQVMFADGAISEMVLGGHFAGSRNEARKIVGFRLIAKSEKQFTLFYSGEFADGTNQKTSNGTWIQHDSSPLKRINFEINVIV
jgi:hypothetical protein